MILEAIIELALLIFGRRDLAPKSPSVSDSIKNFRNNGYRFRLGALFTLTAVLAVVLAIFGYAIRQANLPPLRETLQRELDKTFSTGTPRADVDRWIIAKNVSAVETSGKETFLQWIGLQYCQTKYILRADFYTTNVSTMVRFYFDDDGHLIKFEIDEFRYAL